MDRKLEQQLRFLSSSYHYKPIRTIEELRDYLQNAVTLEFATIPAYSTALYSMTDRSCNAFRLTASVAMEEMYHVYQAANLLVAVGGIPRFTGPFTPVYPTYIPNGDPKTTPYIGLRQATVSVYQEVFMGIETPATFESPPENQNIQTIGQFYKAIQDGIEYLEAQAQQRGTTIFADAEGYAQYQDYYFGRGGGQIVEVRDLESAKRGIRQIVQQGEGGERPGHPLVPLQPWGSYNHYGQRVDGQYGPIIGTPLEQSHYFKFKQVADGVAPLPDVYPIVAVPNLDDYQTNPRALALAERFNALYSLMLRSLEHSFQKGEGFHRLFFEHVVPIMHQHLPNLAVHLMQTPIWKEGSGNIGPNAAPTWQYDKRSLKEQLKGFETLTHAVEKDLRKGKKALLQRGADTAASRDQALLQTLQQVTAHVARIEETSTRLGLHL